MWQIRGGGVLGKVGGEGEVWGSPGILASEQIGSLVYDFPLFDPEKVLHPPTHTPQVTGINHITDLSVCPRACGGYMEGFVSTRKKSDRVLILKCLEKSNASSKLGAGWT